MDRRTFLRVLAASSAAALIGVHGCAGDAQDRTFPQGIASADPTPDGIVLWTRVETDRDREAVRYEVALDESFVQIVATGDTTAEREHDHTVRLAIDGLASSTTYWYRFEARGVISPIGRTKTAPAPGDDAPLRIALTCCQDYYGRWFHSWRALLDRDVDFVLFIGDYIYETIGHLNTVAPADRSLEIPDGLELYDPLKGKRAALTLEDYRSLYRQYRRDPDLRAVHARFPFVTIWDDHEFANDCWKDHSTDFDDEMGDEENRPRREAATRAWYEHTPMRPEFDPAAGFPLDVSIQRVLRWGRHVDLVLLDERYFRDDHLVPEGPIDREVGHFLQYSAFGSRTFVIKDVFDAREVLVQPTMLGAPQRDWAIAALIGSQATWKLLASPLVMAQLAVDLTAYDTLPDMFRKKFYFKTDQWDGFRSERRALFEACSAVENLVVLSGDLHGSYAAELYVDFDAPTTPIAVEYAAPAISAAPVNVQLEAVVAGNAFLQSFGLGNLIPAFDANVLATNPHLLHSESTRNGLAIVDVSAAEVRVTFVEVDEVTVPTGGVAREVAFRTPAGSRRIEPIT